MKNTIRCCISCILPCGALDVIRIVHSNGRVEEIARSVRAEEIMKANPKHVLRKSTTSISDDGAVPRIVILAPDAELQRGKIYFLMPVPSPPEKCSARKKKKREHHPSDDSTPAGARNRNSKSKSNRSSIANHDSDSDEGGNAVSVTKLLVSDRYLSDILSEKISTQRERRRGRVGVWRPHLESIDESPADH
ncbi:hypothetical protein ACLOJK_010558 [Asimina triloba]